MYLNLFKLELRLDNSYFHTYSFFEEEKKTAYLIDCHFFVHILCKIICSYHWYRWTSRSYSKRTHHISNTNYLFHLFQDILEILFLLSSGEPTVLSYGTPPSHGVVSFEINKRFNHCLNIFLPQFFRKFSYVNLRNLIHAWLWWTFGELKIVLGVLLW